MSIVIVILIRICAISRVQIYLDIHSIYMCHPNIFGYLFGKLCEIQIYSDLPSGPFYDICSKLCTVHCELYTLHFALCTVNYPQYTVHYTLLSVLFALYIVHCTLSSMHYTMCNVNFTLYIIHSELYNV